MKRLIKNVKSKQWVMSILAGAAALIYLFTGDQIANAELDKIATGVVAVAVAISAWTDKSNPGFGSHPEEK